MFVTSDNKKELEAISIATGTILAHVPIPISVSGTGPLELAINPDGTHVYVFAPQNQPNSLLMAVNTTTYQVTGVLNLPFNESLGPLLVSPDGTQIYFEVGLVNQYIQVIDAATLKPVTQIVVNENPSGLCTTPSGLILMTDVLNELLVIDPRNAAIVNHFSLPTSIAAVVSSPDSTTAYLASITGPSILAVNIANGATVFNAPIGYTPSQLAISPAGDELYSMDFSNKGAPSISKFDILTQKTVTTMRQLGPLSNMALSHDGSALFVLNANTSAIVPVDVATQKPGRPSLGGLGLNSLAVPAGSQTVWASSYEFATRGDILMLNPATGQTNFIAGPTGGLSFSPDGTILYVANPPAVTAINVQSRQSIARYPAANLENIGQGIPSPDGTRLYVSITFVSGSTPGTVVLPPGEIVVLDALTLKRITTINTPGGLGVFALTPDGTSLVCTANRGEVEVISTVTGAVTATIKLTPTGVLEGIALSNDGSTAYVTDVQNNLLFVVDLVAQSQQAAIGVGTQPLNVALTPDGSAAWVATAAGLDTVNLASGMVGGPVRLPGTPSAMVFVP